MPDDVDVDVDTTIFNYINGNGICGKIVTHIAVVR